MKKKFPSTFYNPVTLTGTAVAIISFGLILFLMILEIFSADTKPYMGIIAFVILPAFLIIGLILIALGIIRENRRRREGIYRERRFPVINLNDSQQRRAVVTFSVGTIVLLLFSAFGSYKAYEYTETDEFCGTVCHTVMEPEYVAYNNSPHSRVGCVGCHIGPGAGWYVRSKLSGAYQVYSVIFDKYSQPIPTPIENLVPSRETCEQCHWPEHFYSQKRYKNTYFISDEDNTKWTLTYLMKIGGGNEETGITEGIHWHMNINNEITYIATDEERMNIPWVKSKNYKGEVTIYHSTEEEITDEMVQNSEKRLMDCIDCHNRPSHIFHNPRTSVNHFMAQGEIDPDLPYMKSLSVKVLEKPYSKKSIALDSIEIAVNNFYELNYPEIYESEQSKIDNAVSQLQGIYELNYFPTMKADWKAHPDNIGHMFAPGCFRCHDGKHVSEDGKVISKDCNVCHTLVSQQYEDEDLHFSLEGVDYTHPVDIGREWNAVECYKCHAGDYYEKDIIKE